MAAFRSPVWRRPPRRFTEGSGIFLRCQPRLASFFFAARAFAITGEHAALRWLAAALSALWGASWRRVAARLCSCRYAAAPSTLRHFFKVSDSRRPVGGGLLNFRICPRRLRAACLPSFFFAPRAAAAPVRAAAGATQRARSPSGANERRARRQPAFYFRVVAACSSGVRPPRLPRPPTTPCVVGGFCQLRPVAVSF